MERWNRENPDEALRKGLSYHTLFVPMTVSKPTFSLALVLVFLACHDQQKDHASS